VVNAIPVKDNGTNAIGLASISASTISFYTAVAYGWTASGATQAEGTLTYPI
jgi:hypothetical protein